MKKLMIIVSFFLCMSCTAHKKKINAYDFHAMDSLITCWIDRGYYPGASIMIAKDNAIVFEKYYGTYTADTEVYIASAGKWLAAATIAAVVDQTSLYWDDPVEKWLPEFKGDPKGKIKLKQLLSHTSGIPDYHTLPKRDTYNDLKDAVADILPLDPAFEPGTRFQYGGLAMQVAGRMAEVASGMDFETLFQEKIARPLGMTNTHFTPVSLEGGHSPMLGGGARTILRDYMNFLHMFSNCGIFDGNRILSVESIYEIQDDQIKSAVVMEGEYVEKALGNHHKSIYGLGVWREKVNSSGIAYQISSPGWAGAYPWTNKLEKIYGFFLTHVEGNSAKKDGFSPFYTAPVLSRMTSQIVHDN